MAFQVQACCRRQAGEGLARHQLCCANAEIRMVDKAFAASAGTISLDAIIESRVHDRPARGEAAKGG